jgi:hypothetical protein
MSRVKRKGKSVNQRSGVRGRRSGERAKGIEIRKEGIGKGKEHF